MPAATVRDLTLVLDAAPGHYTATLCESWPEEGQRPIEQRLHESFSDQFAKLVKAASDERFGEVLCDWLLPPESEIRNAFLRCCEEVEQQENWLRLWICLGSGLANDIYFQLFERRARVSWEGFWVREWADEAKRPSRVRSPFLALNPWITIVRRPPGVSTQRRFTVPGKLNVLIVVSNPPLGSTERHIEYLEREDGTGMLLRVYRPFQHHRGIGWVFVQRNPTKVDIARCIREYKPHVVIYLGHGYAGGRDGSSGLILASGKGNEFEAVSGLQEGVPGAMESQLEQMLAGKVEALSNPGDSDAGLPLEERPRLVILFCCEAAAAAPALLQCGVPAVLAMRRQIPDSDGTEAMVKHCADVLTDESKSIEEAMADLRRFLKEKEPQFVDERLHFSVPVLHLAPPTTMAANRKRQ